MAATASNTAKKTDLRVVDEPTNLEAHYAAEIADACNLMTVGDQTKIGGIIKAGVTLLAAKEGENKLPHGRFLAWVRDVIRWKETKAQCFMSIASHGVLSNAQYAGHLPSAWTVLYELSRVDEDRLLLALEGGDVWPDMDVNHARDLITPETRKRRAPSDTPAPAHISLAEWNELSADEHREYLQPHNFEGKAKFNQQGNNPGIEWAQWSWNPVTGCLHNCPYCYARDIAERFAGTSAYPHGFEPVFRPDQLNAPSRSDVPEEAETDTRFRNVFTCSMADLFGRWVPAEWIKAVLGTIAENPQWNFLCLTKFPKRMAEFEIPPNAWMGTTVDLQARVPNAEAAFAKVKSGIRWLSVEPMLEPLKFKRLDLFQWVVIGGSSKASKTPEWHPPFSWIADLVAQADAVGARVYFKTNLLGNRRLELPFDAPIIGDPKVAPDVFNYLGRKAPE